MRARAARRNAAEGRLFWGAVFAAVVGVVTLILALGFSVIGSATSGNRSSMAAVYLGFGIGGLVVAGVLGLIYRTVVMPNRDPNARSLTDERESRAGRRSP